MESSTQQKVTGACGREGFPWERLEQQRHQLWICRLGVGPGPKLQLTALGCRQSFLWCQETLNQGLGGSVGAK